MILGHLGTFHGRHKGHIPTFSHRKPQLSTEDLKGRPAGAGLAYLCVEAMDAGRGHVLLAGGEGGWGWREIGWKTMGKPWENHGKTTENQRKTEENHGKTMGKSYENMVVSWDVLQTCIMFLIVYMVI